jgi:hypothetical protein
MVIIACKILENNQCPQDWLNTKAFTIGERISTKI